MFDQINTHILQHWQVGLDFQFSPSLQAPVFYLCVTSHSQRLAAKDLVAADGACMVQGHQFTTDLGRVVLKDLV